MSDPSTTSDLRRRLGKLRFSPEREAEVIEELSLHLDDRVRELVAGGVSPQDARRTALSELSNHRLLSPHFASLRQAHVPERVQPGVPGTRFVRDLWRDIRYAVRTACRQPGFTAAAVLTLALGIGANTAIFSLVNATLLVRLPLRAPEQLVYAFNGRVGGVFSYPAYEALRNGNHVFDGYAAWGGITASLNADGVTDLVTGVIVTGNFFQLLGVDAERGRVLSPIDDATVGGHPVAVISHQLWQTRFGARGDIVGHEVLLNSRRFTIVGVTPPEFKGPQLGVVRNLYVPMMMQAVMRPPRAGYSGEMNPDLLKNPGNSWLSTVGRLKPGVTPMQAGTELGALATHFIRTLDPAAPERRVTVIPVDEGDPNQREQLRSAATLLGSVVGVVLLIACANVANLLLSRTASRRRELAVRLAIGASRGRIVRQLVTESVLLAVGGGMVGAGLAWLLVRAFKGSPPPAGALPVAIDFAIDRRVMLFSFVLSLVTGVVFGLVPALRASRPGLLPALKDESFVPDERSRRFGPKQALVVAEVALSVGLLVVAGLFVRSLAAARSIDPGIDAEKLVTTPLNVNLLRYTRAQGRQFYQQVIERLEAVPGVEAAAVARVAVLTGSGRTSSLAVEGRAARGRFTSEGGGMVSDDPDSINVNVVSAGFFRTLGIGLVRGRDFGVDDVEKAPPVAIVNETAARRHFPGADPIGKRVSVAGPEGPWLQIVGVVRDSKYAEIGETPLPIAYLPLAQNHETGVTLYVRARVPPASLVGAVRREVQALEPNLPVAEVRTMADTIGVSLYAPRMGAVLLSAFGGLAVLLAAVGVYGVLAFSIARRTREMGIRVALGADRETVFGLVVREGMTLVAIGMTVGLAGAAAGATWLGSFLYTIGPRDPLAFATAPLLLSLVALAACLVPAYRAMRVSPIVALRHD